MHSKHICRKFHTKTSHKQTRTQYVYKYRVDFMVIIVIYAMNELEFSVYFAIAASQNYSIHE